MKSLTSSHSLQRTLLQYQFCQSHRNAQGYHQWESSFLQWSCHAWGECQIYGQYELHVLLGHPHHRHDELLLNSSLIIYIKHATQLLWARCMYVLVMHSTCSEMNHICRVTNVIIKQHSVNRIRESFLSNKVVNLWNTQSHMHARTHARTHAHTHTHTRLMSLFWDYPGEPVPER